MIKVVLVVYYDEHSDTKRTKPLIDSVPFSQCALQVALRRYVHNNNNNNNGRTI